MRKWRSSYDRLDETAASLSQFLEVAVDLVSSVLLARFQIGVDGHEDAGSATAVTNEPRETQRTLSFTNGFASIFTKQKTRSEFFFNFY